MSRCPRETQNLISDLCMLEIKSRVLVTKLCLLECLYTIETCILHIHTCAAYAKNLQQQKCTWENSSQHTWRHSLYDSIVVGDTCALTTVLASRSYDCDRSFVYGLQHQSLLLGGRRTLKSDTLDGAGIFVKVSVWRSLRWLVRI